MNKKVLKEQVYLMKYELGVAGSKTLRNKSAKYNEKSLYKEGDLSEQQKHDLSNGVYDYAVTLVNDVSVIIDKINVELNSL